MIIKLFGDLNLVIAEVKVNIGKIYMRITVTIR